MLPSCRPEDGVPLADSKASDPLSPGAAPCEPLATNSPPCFPPEHLVWESVRDAPLEQPLRDAVVSIGLNFSLRSPLLRRRRVWVILDSFETRFVVGAVDVIGSGASEEDFSGSGLMLDPMVTRSCQAITCSIQRDSRYGLETSPIK